MCVACRQPALAIVNSRHWKRALRACDKNNATPLRLLIQYLPGRAHCTFTVDNILVGTFQMLLKLYCIDVLRRIKRIRKLLKLKCLLSFWMIFKI